MLGGAAALNAYTGVWRVTKDLDLFVPGKTMERVLDTLEEAGFETDVADARCLAKAWKGELFVDIIHGSHNGTGPVDESWLANARGVAVLYRHVFVIPAEMILSKIFVVAKDRCDVDDVSPPHLRYPRQPRLGPHALKDRRSLGAPPRLPPLLPLRLPESHTHCLPQWVLQSLLERYEEEDGTLPTVPSAYVFEV